MHMGQYDEEQELRILWRGVQLKCVGHITRQVIDSYSGESSTVKTKAGKKELAKNG